MNVFISWSGETSKRLAKSFSDWLPLILQNIDIFYSPDDIRKGEFWTSRLRDELKTNVTGIIFLTKKNRNSPWILFESGALANGIGKGKVFPIIFDFEISELINPLALFNATKFGKEDIKKLIYSINQDFGDKAIKEDRVDKIFEKFWPDLNDEISDILKSRVDESDTESSLTEPEMVKESLKIQKQIVQYLSQGDKSNFSEEFNKISNQLSVIEKSISLLNKVDLNSTKLQGINSRPISLKAHLHRFTQDRANWIGFVGLNEFENPVEIFIFPEDNEIFPLPKSIVKGQIVTKVEEFNEPGYAFVYLDKYGYKNTLGGLDRMVHPDAYNYTLLLNSILSNSLGFELANKIIDGIKAKAKTPLATWKIGINKILKRYQ